MSVNLFDRWLEAARGGRESAANFQETHLIHRPTMYFIKGIVSLSILVPCSRKVNSKVDTLLGWTLEIISRFVPSFSPFPPVFLSFDFYPPLLKPPPHSICFLCVFNTLGNIKQERILREICWKVKMQICVIILVLFYPCCVCSPHLDDR